MEFRKELERLISTYGKAYYSDERVKLIWKEVGMLPASSFESIVEHLISESRQAPLIPEIRERAARAREFLWKEQKAEQSNVIEFNSMLCIQCGGIGVVLARRKESLNNGYAFKCNCANGSRYPAKYPTWNESIAEVYVMTSEAS
jgi:hypothetical protein